MGGIKKEPKLKKDWQSQFKEWLKEICPWDNIERYVQFVGHIPSKWKLKIDDVNVDTKIHVDEDTIRIRVFTKNYCYGIAATGKYLGCTVSRRKSRAGEDWTRGSDLPDGKFSRNTWEKIQHAIVRYELVRVMKPQKAYPDENGVIPMHNSTK